MGWVLTLKTFALLQLSTGAAVGRCPQCWRRSGPCSRAPASAIFGELAWAVARNILRLIRRFEMANLILKVEEGKNSLLVCWISAKGSFFFYRKPCLRQFSSRRPELNISIFGERHMIKFPLPRWINGMLPNSQGPLLAPLKPHPSSLPQKESMLKFVSIIHSFVFMVFCFKYNFCMFPQ